jgi:nicotinamide phosphoribosyltransferase
MLPNGTEYVYSYCEPRTGAKYDNVVFFGLQYILKTWLQGVVVTKELIDEAEPLLKEHFKFNGDVWHREKWDYIVRVHGGKLPIKIKALPEGTKIPVSNALFTIENTDPNCAWLTNACETVLMNVWHATTVCTRSNLIVSIIRNYFNLTVEDTNKWLASYTLHDFGQRGCSGMEQAGMGGAAHLVNSMGTDSVMGMIYAMNYYGANKENLGYSVPASEHSCATALGKEGEFEVVKHLIRTYPNGILSVVSDSYDIENAIKIYCTELKPLILSRNGKFVVRPDSPRWKGDTPEEQVLWIIQELEKGFGSTVNKKGYKTLDSHIGVIYGDGLTEVDIHNILEILCKNGYAADNCVYGCGGYLLQRDMSRDTQRFALKASSMCINGVWHEVYKEPSDRSKASKKGRLAVVNHSNTLDGWTTVSEDLAMGGDRLVTVFENGNITKEWTFDEIRKTAQS